MNQMNEALTLDALDHEATSVYSGTLTGCPYEQRDILSGNKKRKIASTIRKQKVINNQQIDPSLQTSNLRESVSMKEFVDTAKFLNDEGKMRYELNKTKFGPTNTITQ